MSEFAGRHNARSMDTGEQMQRTAVAMVGKRLPYAELVGETVARAVTVPDGEPW